MSLMRNSEILLFIRYEKEDFFCVFQNQSVSITSENDRKKIETGAELAGVGRQVTVFVKEDDWKVSSIYYIGNE